MLRALIEHRHRVLSRSELSRLAGLTGLSARRCDSVLVQIRRSLGPSAIMTIRARGWMLHPDAFEVAAAALRD